MSTTATKTKRNKGQYTKAELRSIARSNGKPTAKRPLSMTTRAIAYRKWKAWYTESNRRMMAKVDAEHVAKTYTAAVVAKLYRKATREQLVELAAARTKLQAARHALVAATPPNGARPYRQYEAVERATARYETLLRAARPDLFAMNGGAQ